jgi:hypothetical protein
VTLQTLNVTLQTLNVTLQTLNVTLQTLNVTLQTLNVTLQTSNVTLHEEISWKSETHSHGELRPHLDLSRASAGFLEDESKNSTHVLENKNLQPD